jgi:hypothetical protein
VAECYILSVQYGAIHLVSFLSFYCTRSARSPVSSCNSVQPNFNKGKRLTHKLIPVTQLYLPQSFKHGIADALLCLTGLYACRALHLHYILFCHCWRLCLLVYLQLATSKHAHTHNFELRRRYQAEPIQQDPNDPNGPINDHHGPINDQAGVEPNTPSTTQPEGNANSAPEDMMQSIG